MTADGQVAWFWRPWAGAKFAGDDLASDVDYEVTDTGKSAKQPLTPSCRECRLFGFACSDYAGVLSLTACQAAGAAQHPAFPAPSPISRVCFGNDSGAKRAAGMLIHAPFSSLRATRSARSAAG